jgi:DNA-binding response OmpR family regulator
MTGHVLIVDDEALIRSSLSYSLDRAGYRTSTAFNAEDALAIAQRDHPDLVLLDIGLPGMDGLEAIGYFRSQIGCPVIFVTARRRELDEVVGLELGADDFVTKPFDVDVLLARIKAVLRRSTRDGAHGMENQSGVITLGSLSVDTNACVVAVRGQPVNLSPREFDLLQTLALEAGRVLSVDQLLARVWGVEFMGEPQVVYVHIRWLREKLEDDPSKPSRILTVRGKGYKLVSIGEPAGVPAET